MKQRKKQHDVWRALKANAIIAFLIWPLIGTSLAQTRSDSSLKVVVLDPTGASVASAYVVLQKGGANPLSYRSNDRGEVSFSKLTPGLFRLSVEAPGFEPYQLDVSIKPGSNKLEVRLNVAGVKDEVSVKESEKERATDPRGNAFSTVLTADQIAALPDDPDEFENAIRQMAGPGAPLRVNGFRGGKLPPKSQIREIRFRMNPYSADNHESDLMSIDILTKPGVDSWHGSLGFGFRDESLNARNAFAPFRGAEQFRRSTISLDGPIWRNHTSMFLSGDALSSYDSKTIVAALPEGPLTDVARRPQFRLNLQARVEHALTKTHTLHGEYQRNATRQDNLGVGDYDLPERAYASRDTEHIIRIADTGPLSKRLVNEFRFQARLEDTEKTASSSAPAIIVLNSFNEGGAQVGGGRTSREFELADNLDFVKGKHSIRTGLLLETGNYQSDEFNNAGGTFTFSGLDAFVGGRPTTFTRRFGDPALSFSRAQLGWYVLDDIRLRKDLTLSFGLRHELQTQLPDKNNFAPRVGAAWSPFKSGKTTFRVGAGIFYSWFDAATYEQTLRVDGERQKDLVIQDPGFPNPLAGGSEVVLPPSRIVREPNMVMPYVEQFSFGVQRQLNKFSQLVVNYTHQRGVHLLRGHNINAPLSDGVRPDPSEGNVVQVESTANSTFNGLMVNANMADARRHFFFAVNYFLSKATNESDSPSSLPANNFDLRAERGPAGTDARHRLFAVTNFGLASGFRVGAMFHIRSATPYNITTGFDDNRDTVSNDRPPGVGRNSARGAAEWDLSTRLSWGLGWGKAAEPGGGRPMVKVIRGGNRSDVLGGLGPVGSPNKRFHLDFYVQAFNVLNHVNLTNFSGVETSPFFGVATAAQPGRRIEGGTRFSF